MRRKTVDPSALSKIFFRDPLSKHQAMVLNAFDVVATPLVLFVYAGSASHYANGVSHRSPGFTVRGVPWVILVTAIRKKPGGVEEPGASACGSLWAEGGRGRAASMCGWRRWTDGDCVAPSGL